MSSHKNVSAAATENVAKRTCKSITAEEIMAGGRMKGGQSHPTVYRGLNMTPSTVTTVMKNADKIKRSHQLV
jgi:hypothetical protein